MPRPTSGNDEQSVDAHIIAVAQIARRELLGGNDNPSQPPLIQRKGGGILAGPGLDLDEREDATATGDDIDLAAVDPGPA